MCTECHKLYCPSACPGAAAPSHGQCAYCGEPIREGEAYLREGRDLYHADCLESLSLTELLAYFGIDLTEAYE